MIWIGTAIFLTVIVVSFAMWRILKSERDGEWRPDSPEVMRRFVKGRWETRPMSVDEISDYQKSDAW